MGQLIDLYPDLVSLSNQEVAIRIDILDLLNRQDKELNISTIHLIKKLNDKQKFKKPQRSTSEEKYKLIIYKHVRAGICTLQKSLFKAVDDVFAITKKNNSHRLTIDAHNDNLVFNEPQ